MTQANLMNTHVFKWLLYTMLTMTMFCTCHSGSPHNPLHSTNYGTCDPTFHSTSYHTCDPIDNKVFHYLNIRQSVPSTKLEMETCYALAWYHAVQLQPSGADLKIVRACTIWEHYCLFIGNHCSITCFNCQWQHSSQERPTEILTIPSWSPSCMDTDVSKLTMVVSLQVL